jgi:hypothetical protein
MKLTAIWRIMASVGVTSALLLGSGGSSMASAPVNQVTKSALNMSAPRTLGEPQAPSVIQMTNASGSGTITITETSSTQGTATWTWSGLTKSQYVSVYVGLKNNLGQLQLLTSSSGQVTQSGQYTANITLPSGDTWSNVEIKMTESAFATGQLPEVPWAAGLPLLLLIPLGISMKRRLTRA